MFEVILDAVTALLLIGGFLFVLKIILQRLGPFVSDLIFERKESVAREEAKRIINDGNFDGWLADRMREPLYKKILNSGVKKKIIDSTQTLLIAFGLMVAVALGGQILMKYLNW